MGERPGNDATDRHPERVEALCRAYADALLHSDEIGAEIAIREAMDAGLTMAEIDDDVIAPALWLIGQLWERGEISVADEHIATEISLRMLALQREAQRVARTRGDHRVMLAAPSGELHVMALRMVGDLLRNAGFDVLMLGADVPARALAESAVRHRPDVVCLTTTMPGGAYRVLDSIAEVRQRWPEAGFVLGGHSLSARVRAEPRLDVCLRVSEAVEAVDAIVQRAEQN